MYENIQVQCSGAFYASLHCDIIHNTGIQEGFFKGEIEKHTSFDINDSDLSSENATIKINISGFIPCSTVGNFYNGCGKIDPRLIENLADNMEEIVGWYRCRRCTNGSFLKEIKVHEQLCELFSSKDKYFLFAIFTRNNETSSPKMDVSYKFQVMLNRSCEFTSIPLNIINLNNTSAAEYIKTASSTLYNSEALEKILLTIQNLEPGVKEVESIHTGLIHQVQSLLPKFALVQEKYRLALQRVNHLRECCHNFELKSDEGDDTKSISEEGSQDNDDSCEHSEEDQGSEIESKSENKKLLNTREPEKASCIENSKCLNNDKNGMEISRSKDDKIEKKKSKSHSSQKEILHSEDGNKKGLDLNVAEVVLKDSDLKRIKPSSLENTCKGSKNETNVILSKKAIVKETKSAETNKMCSDSPEF